MNGVTLYTIGHGNRPIEELISVLRSATIATLVDIRANPHSTRFPQFDEDSLRASVTATGMVYHWAGRQLGGRRKGVPNSRHCGLSDAGERGFADYMDSLDFRRAASQLARLASRAPAAILCAEKDPLCCHRSLISDYLTLQGVRVVHLLSASESHDHLLSPHARRESAELIYDRNTSGELAGL